VLLVGPAKRRAPRGEQREPGLAIPVGARERQAQAERERKAQPIRVRPAGER
jgi:hypothetical protein